MRVLQIAFVVLIGWGLPLWASDKIQALFDHEEKLLIRAGEAHLVGLIQGSEDAGLSSDLYSSDWLEALPAAQGGDEWQCLTEALYFEARGETIMGQFAVAEVIVNRMKSKKFPDSICGVVNQGTGRRYACQFTYTCDGRPEHIANEGAWERVGKVARASLDEKVPLNLTDGATFYHTTGVNPSWASKFTRVAQYGVHLFYRPPLRTANR